MIRAWGASLVVHWLRICLPMQGTQVWSLVQEDPTCCRATKLLSHNYWAHVPHLLKPACQELVLCHKRNYLKREGHAQQRREPLLTATRESNKDPVQPKRNKICLKSQDKTSRVPETMMGNPDYPILVGLLLLWGTRGSQWAHIWPTSRLHWWDLC